MTEDDNTLNAFLQLATNVELKQQAEEEFWFSHKNQKKLTYNLAAKMMLSVDEITPEEAIKESKKFHDLFYTTILKH